MYLLYADEFGHDGIWDPNDRRHNHHPLFGLAGFALPADRWRELDRAYLRLKKAFYTYEIQRAAAEGIRPERFEPKDLSSRRDIRFTHAVLTLLRSLDATVFVQGRVKPVGGPHNSDALYGSVTQGLMRAFEKFLRKREGPQGRGLILLDRRREDRDVQLLYSAQSYLFSAHRDIPGGFSGLIEVPMLVRSEWHHGVQAADTVARAAGRVFRYRLTQDPACKKFDDKLGVELDTLEYRRHVWSTVFIAQSVAPVIDAGEQVKKPLAQDGPAADRAR